MIIESIPSFIGGGGGGGGATRRRIDDPLITFFYNHNESTYTSQVKSLSIRFDPRYHKVQWNSTPLLKGEKTGGLCKASSIIIISAFNFQFRRVTGQTRVPPSIYLINVLLMVTSRCRWSLISIVLPSRKGIQI